jgi:signal transduction histidine kinase
LASFTTHPEIWVNLKPAHRLTPAGWRSRLPTSQNFNSAIPEASQLIIPKSLERVLFLLRWLVTGLSLAIQLYAAGGSGDMANIARALQFTALAAVYNSFFFVLRYNITRREPRIWLAVFDAAVITVLIGFGGGIYSPFIFLLYLIIVEASLLFTPSGVLTYTAVVAMFYAILTMLLPGQKWDELNITIVLSVVLGMFIWASICGAINHAFEQERALVRREKDLAAELNRQVVALSAINRLSEQLNASLDLEELMQSTVKALPDALAVDACVAFLASRAGARGWDLGPVWYGIDEDFEPPAENDLALASLAPNKLRVGPLVVDRADIETLLVDGTILRFSAGLLAENGELESLPALAGSAGLMVPLSLAEGHGGALVVLRQDGPVFNESDKEILAALARQLSLLANNARLYELERRNVARLQELEEMKSDFLSTVSHELRTPLTSIKASIILMLTQPDQPRSTAQRLLRNIDRNTERLSSLVNDLLDMTKLQNGRLKLACQPVNLADIAADVTATMRPLTDNKSQTLTVQVQPGLPAVYADRRRVEQVLNNLLSNAYRYTPKNGSIRLAVEVRERQALVAITDNGPGIPLSEQELVFERFYSGNSGKGGTGLGLAIARSLVELHNGLLWVESQPGKGSSFYFTLPLASTASIPLKLNHSSMAV